MGFWKFLFTGLLADFTGSPGLRGREGELLVSHVLSKLPESKYQIHEDLLLPSSRGGDTQIDHVVFSCFGIFVIEVKNYRGWIFAGKNDRFWTQVNYRQKDKFQNPLRQNYGHIKALQFATGLPMGVFHNIVIFTGSAKFKTAMPDNVGYGGDLRKMILAQQYAVLSPPQINNAIVAVLGKTQFDPGAKRRHVRNLQARHK